MNKKKHILTVDVEDWFQSSREIFADVPNELDGRPEPSVVANTLKCLEWLNRTSNRATFFVLGSVAESYPDLVREILLKGHEVGSHGYAHRLVYRMNPNQFESDLRKSLDILARAGSSNVQGFRAPYWSVTKKSLWALDIIASCGLRYDSSIFPAPNPLYGIAEAPREPHLVLPELWEFPPATLRLGNFNFPIAGGGYLRLLPYTVFARALRIFERETTGVFYFHPYELDPKDVRLPYRSRSLRTLVTRMTQAAGRSGNPKKIERFLTENRFQSISEWLAARKNAGASREVAFS